MAKLSKQYDPKGHEQKIYEQWENANVFSPDEKALNDGKEPYTIMLPLPNVTGNLHMGHALQHTISDILIRYHRMNGHPTLWQPGTDHAGIATQKVVEKKLHNEGKTRHDLGREKFLEKIWEWKEESGNQIVNQMKRLGASADWSRTKFTMDDDYYAAVQQEFIHYYKNGYIYRGNRIVNWDPDTQTTVSDLEIDWKTEKTPLYTFKYGPFEISTARPETKFGDKYVVVHPSDKRYAQYKDGDTFEAEWINGKISATVIKDDSIDPKFGTGAMTITPWHDTTDFEIAQRHDLDMEQVIGFDGKLLPVAEEFAGQTIAQARPMIVAKLEEKGLLVSVDEKYEHNVALNDRGKGMIEPQIMRQWFVDMGKIKAETIDVAESEVIEFLPPRWKKHFLDWMENVYDWNISRQLWWGHRIPVWWKENTRDTENEEGNFVVSLEKPDGSGWEQDPDVLDTWFSSALWPFATLGWPKPTQDLQKFYPTSVLITARDILYLWVARMIFSGLELMKGEEYGNRNQSGRIPFKEVFIHPTVLAKDGQRMSKSLGTGVDPLELIEEYGADATRFGLMHQMSFDSQAIKFDPEALRAARNFANKIWNIARLLESLEDREEETIADAWIKDRAAAVTLEASALIESYKVGEAARLIQEFIWKEYADWYIEIVKNEGSTKIAREVFSQLLTMLHPFMPFITEVLWQLTGKEGMLASGTWNAGKKVSSSHKEMQYFINLVSAIRTARNLFSIPPSATITIHAKATPLTQSLQTMAKVEIADETKDDMRAFPVGSSGSVKIFSEYITEDNTSQVRQKLEKEKEELDKMIAQQENILTHMEGKAIPEKIEDKKQQIITAQSRKQELERSLELL